MPRRREPNPWNERAREVAEIILQYAQENKVSPDSLSRAQIRQLLKEKSTEQKKYYTSEGALSRDLAAIRKYGKEYGKDIGDPRRYWASTNYKEVFLDGEQTYAVKLMAVPKAGWRGSVTVGALVGDTLVFVGFMASGDPGVDRQRATTLLTQKIKEVQKDHQQWVKKKPYRSKCAICGVNEPDVYDPDYGYVCIPCLESLSLPLDDEDEIDDYSSLPAIGWNADPKVEEMFVFVDRDTPWLRRGRP